MTMTAHPEYMLPFDTHKVYFLSSFWTINLLHYHLEPIKHYFETHFA